jgi:hypothetical protein
MPADPVTAEPKHPLHAMTTFELRDERKRLEQALRDKVIGQAPVAKLLREHLDAVLAEQDERARIAKSR